MRISDIAKEDDVACMHGGQRECQVCECPQHRTFKWVDVSDALLLLARTPDRANPNHRGRGSQRRRMHAPNGHGTGVRRLRSLGTFGEPALDTEAWEPVPREPWAVSQQFRSNTIYYVLQPGAVSQSLWTNTLYLVLLPEATSYFFSIDSIYIDR